MRMQRPLEIDWFPTLRTSPDNVKIPCNRPPLTVIQRPRLSITYPGMRASPPRVHPQDMDKPEIFPERTIDDADRQCHEPPAPPTDIGLGAAGTYVVVVSQVNVEAEFFGDGLECRAVGELLPVARVE